MTTFLLVLVFVVAVLVAYFAGMTRGGERAVTQLYARGFLTLEDLYAIAKGERK